MTNRRDLEQRFAELREGEGESEPTNLAEVLSDLMAADREDDSHDE